MKTTGSASTVCCDNNNSTYNPAGNTNTSHFGGLLNCSAPSYIRMHFSIWLGKVEQL